MDNNLYIINKITYLNFIEKDKGLYSKIKGKKYNIAFLKDGYSACFIGYKHDLDFITSTVCAIGNDLEHELILYTLHSIYHINKL